MRSKYVNDTFIMIKYNLKSLIKFELLYKILLGLILIPLVVYIFHFSMKLTGYQYLTLENIRYFLLNPLTFFFFLLIIIFLTIITLFDICALVILFDESYHQKKIEVKELIKISLKKCFNLFKIKNILIIFFVLFLIPFLKIGISSNVITTIKIPEFIMDFIWSNKYLSFIYTILYLFLFSFLSKWIFSLHYMILEGKNFKNARRCSKKLIKNNQFKDQLIIFVVQIIFALITFFCIIIGIMIIIFIIKISKHLYILESVLITIIGLFISITLIVYNIISNSISYAVISCLYYKHKIDISEKIKEHNYTCIVKSKKQKKIFIYLTIIVCIFSLIGGSLFTHQVITGKFNLNIENIREMEVTAHRGSSIKYPENTLLAFNGAKRMGADWIELDVQQTKDGHLVVIHDHNLSRVAGIKKNVIDLNYQEIKKIDVGSYKDKKYKGEKIPELFEVIEFAKNNNIKLNIELKTSGREKNFEESIVNLIKEYNFQEMCVVSSQIYSVLEKVKKIDKNIKTVYVMSIAIGNITKLKYADAFSVEASNINKKIVNLVHNEGKQIYAWTVNTESSINKMIEMNVDNIITDNIELAIDLVKRSRNSNLINEFIKKLIG